DLRSSGRVAGVARRGGAMRFAQLDGQLRGNLRAPVIGRGRVLEERDAPAIVPPARDQRLHRVDGRVYIRLTRRDHPGDSTQTRDAPGRKADAANLADIRGRRMMREYLGERRLDLARAVIHAAVEADRVAFRLEQRGEVAGAAAIPRIEQRGVQRSRRVLVV